MCKNLLNIPNRLGKMSKTARGGGLTHTVVEFWWQVTGAST